MLPAAKHGRSTSVDKIDKEIRRFLADTEPEVICISGHWGVGKTFAWCRQVENAQKTDTIGFGHYSYVSLFGVNSLDEFKYAIFENSVRSSAAGIEPSLDTLKTNTTRNRGTFWEEMDLLPATTTESERLRRWIRPLWFLSVKNSVICIDDIERHGDGLKIRDILGLVSFLKEHKEMQDRVDFER